MYLISEKYIELNKELHQRPRGYGGGGGKWAKSAAEYIQKYSIKSLLDYGCGQQGFWKKVQEDFPDIAERTVYRGYDPCIEALNTPPEEVDMVVCTDVLEHIEPKCLNNVLDHLLLLTRKVIFFNIALEPANKTLADGRNAHLILESAMWWMQKITWWFDEFNGWKVVDVSGNKRKNKFNLVLVKK